MSPTLLEDAQALKVAAEHIESTHPGMAALMRRCATGLYQSMTERHLERANLAETEIARLRDCLERMSSLTNEALRVAADRQDARSAARGYDKAEIDRRTCQTCGMLLDDAGEYHPYIFCVLKKAGRDPWQEIRTVALQLHLGDPGERPPLIRGLHGLR